MPTGDAPRPPPTHAAPHAPDDHPLPTPEPLANDLLCVACGYNLRGLLPSAACPECAAPVARSLHGDLLRYADPAFVRALRRGAMTIYGAAIGAAAMILIATLVAYVFRTLAPAAPAPVSRAPGLTIARSGVPKLSPSGAAAGVLSALWLTLMACVLLGWWWLTTPDPGKPETARSATSRMLVRVALTVALVAFASATTIESYFGIRPLSAAAAGAAPASPAATAALAFIALGFACLALAYFAGLSHCRRLGLRLPSHKVVDRTRGLRLLAILFLFACAGLATLVIFRGPWPGFPIWPSIFFSLRIAFGCGSPILLLLSYIYFLFMIDSLCRGLAHPAEPDAP